MTKIKKAIFPVAGLGTRFLPATKANPKEMLPIVDKPLIQYAVEEAIEAGIEQMIFVTSYTKRAIEDHFDRNLELELALEASGKLEMLSTIKSLVPEGISITYVRQEKALGLGHAILCAKHLIQDEPFAVLLADDLMYNNGPRCLAQMVEYFKNNSVGGVLGIEQVSPSETNKYGIVSLDSNNKIYDVVEKPEPDNAPSNSAIVGRYILPSIIFDYLNQTSAGIGNEIQLTDAIQKILSEHDIHGLSFNGKRYDCGSKLGYAQANFDYTIRDETLGPAFLKWVRYKSINQIA